MVQIKIKDKVFDLDNSKSIYDILYILQNAIEVNIGGINMFLLQPRVSNFKLLLNFVKDKDSLQNYYNKLLNDKKQSNKNLFEKYNFLYEFQKESIKKIINSKYNGYLLSLEQGLGKTVTSITSAEINKSNNNWIIAPASLLNQWKDEIIKWTNSKDIFIYNQTPKKRLENYDKGYKWNIVSYETLRNDFKKNKLLKDILSNSYMIFDESTKLKNNKTKSYKFFKDICKSNKYNLFLTGTPVNNNLKDIDNIINLINPNITNVSKHLEYEEVRVGWGHNAKVFFKLVGYKYLDEYSENIQPVYFRKTKEQVADFLPKKNIISIDVKQTPLHEKLKDEIIKYLSPFQGFTLLQLLETGYENLTKSKSENIQAILQLNNEEIKLYDNIVNKLLNDKKNVNPKLDILKDLLSEINNQVLIFSRFKSSCENIYSYLKQKFPDKNIQVVTSNTKNKNEIASKFRNGEVDYIISTDTWAKGISFTNINYLINFDISASYEMYFQKQDRIHRLDSKSPKFIYNLVGNIIENHVIDLLQDKIELAEKITEGKVSNYSDKDLKNEVIKKLGW